MKSRQITPYLWYLSNITTLLEVHLYNTFIFYETALTGWISVPSYYPLLCKRLGLYAWHDNHVGVIYKVVLKC